MTKAFQIVKVVIFATLSILTLSDCYEQYALYKASKLPLDGKYIDINNHKIHVVQKGTGNVPVIFVSGWDTIGHMSWKDVQNKIAKQTYTLSYDRAGILRSDSSDKPRNCTNIAEELYEILKKNRVHKPYIIVAHSLGGIFTRCLIKHHKQDVAGIILVDSAHPNQIDFYEKKIQNRMKKLPPLWLVKLESYSGLVRGYNYLYGRDISHTKHSDIRNVKNNAFISKSYISYIREGKHILQMKEEINGTNFGNIPLIVLSAKKTKKTQGIALENWKILQNELANLSTNSKHIWVDAGHYIQLEKPNVVVDSINEMIKNIKSFK
ncbi:MAG: alpha/beta hydrolase [Sulfurovum sp.]|nr:alpha/beta hydrolase [Sulfurovum sp.]